MAATAQAGAGTATPMADQRGPGGCFGGEVDELGSMGTLLEMAERGNSRRLLLSGLTVWMRR